MADNCRHQDRSTCVGNSQRFHCNDCNGNFDSSPTTEETAAPEEATKPFVVKPKKSEKSKATVKAVASTKLDDKQKKRAVEIKAKAKADACKKRLAVAEKVIGSLGKKFKALQGFNGEYKTCTKFCDLAKSEEFQIELELARKYFATKPVDELLFGKYRTGNQWSLGEFNITYGHVRRFSPPKQQFLLTTATPEEAKAALAEEDETVTPATPPATPEIVDGEFVISPEIKSQTVAQAATTNYMSVEEVVRRSLAFAQSCYKGMSSAEVLEVLDSLIAKLQSERDFVAKEVAQETEEEVPEEV